MRDVGAIDPSNEPSPGPGPTSAPSAAVTWTWDGALLGASYAVPAALVAAHDVSLGMAFGVGVLPAAIVGVAPRRRARVATGAQPA